MVGYPAGVRLAGQPLELRQVIEVERISAADGERNAVHHDGISLGDLLQHIAWPSLRVDEVFRDDLEPIDRRPLAQDMREVNAPQANAKAEVAGKCLTQRRRGAKRTANFRHHLPSAPLRLCVRFMFYSFLLPPDRAAH